MEKAINSKRKWWIGVPAALIGMIFICIFLIPTFLSSSSGKQFIIGMIEKKTKGNLEIGDLSLGWFQDQQVDNLQFLDNKGEQIAFEKLTSDLSFGTSL